VETNVVIIVSEQYDRIITLQWYGIALVAVLVGIMLFRMCALRSWI
jgi:hypothetical protein